MVSASEVAAAAGVSVSTVSRALSNPEMVAPLTQERVVMAARRLGYHPNLAARGLRLGRSHAIGLILPDLENPFFASVTKAVQARARAAGYVVVVVDSEEDPANEPGLVGALAQRTDGLLLSSPRSDEETLERITNGIPTVAMSRAVPGLPSVAADDVDGAGQVLGHLRALGHRRVAVAAGPARSWSGAHRAAGLRAAAERFGDVTLIELGHFLPYFSGGVVAADHAVASGATAVVAFNDLMAVGLIARLHDRGIRVPENMSVVGFDDTLVAELITPTLTTVRVPRASIARRAVDLLIAALDATDPIPAEPVSILLPVELIIRGSTAAVRPGGLEPHKEAVLASP